MKGVPLSCLRLNLLLEMDIQQPLLAYAAGIRYFIESFVDTIMYNYDNNNVIINLLL